MVAQDPLHCHHYIHFSDVSAATEVSVLPAGKGEEGEGRREESCMTHARYLGDDEATKAVTN